MNNKMKAAVFEGEGKLTLKEVPIPVIDDDGDEVLIEVEAVSICGTDVSIVRVPPAFIIEPGIILGHELVGHIIKKGRSVKNLKVGDRIVVNPNDYCGRCYYCRSNLPNLCENLRAMGVGINGAFAKYVKTTEKVCYKISETIPAEKAVFAEPLACVINGMNKVRVRPGETVTIMGAGPIGLLFLQMFKAGSSSKVIMSEISKYRRDFTETIGVDIIIDPQTQDLKDIVLKETVYGSDIVVDTVGSQMAAGIDIVRKGGKLLIFGGKTDAITSFKQINIITKEISVLGTFLANASFQHSVRVLETGKISTEKLVTHKIPLSGIHDGIKLLEEVKAVKVLITPIDE